MHNMTDHISTKCVIRCKCTLPTGMLSEWALSNNGTSNMVNLAFIWSFSLINWVDNVNWPPSIVSKLTLRALALHKSDWRNCGLCVCVFAVFTRFKRRSRESMVLEKCGVIFTGQTRLSKGNFPFNLDNTLSIVQFPFWNEHVHSEWCFSCDRARDRAGITSIPSIALTLRLLMLD